MLRWSLVVLVVFLFELDDKEEYNITVDCFLSVFENTYYD